MTALSKTASLLASCVAECAETLGLDGTRASLEELQRLAAIARLLIHSSEAPAALLVRSDGETVASQIDTWIEWGRVRDRLRSELRAGYGDDLLALDLEQLRARTRDAEGAWRPLQWWKLRVVRKALASAAREAVSPGIAQIAGTLDRALALRDAQRKLDAAADEARQLVGHYWNGSEAEWDGLATLRIWARDVRSLAAQAAGADSARSVVLRQRWAEFVGEGRALLHPDQGPGRSLGAISGLLEAYRQTADRAAALLDLDRTSAWGGTAEAGHLDRVSSVCARWLAALPELRAWCAWLRARADAVSAGLSLLVEAHEHGSVAGIDLGATFERSYAQWWLAALADREPVLSQFFSPEHERKIEQFRAADERYTELTRKLIDARLAQRVPASGGTVLPGSELGILRREIAKKRRHMSVRQLLQKTGGLLGRLKPCLLMSPMSVAQYLDASHPQFDLVVFDEASQIPVWDSVGAEAGRPSSRETRGSCLRRASSSAGTRTRVWTRRG